jgi:hypothetical protein
MTFNIMALVCYLAFIGQVMAQTGTPDAKLWSEIALQIGQDSKQQGKLEAAETGCERLAVLLVGCSRQALDQLPLDVFTRLGMVFHLHELAQRMHF